MTNLRTDEMVFICNLTKIGTDENKAIYSTNFWSQILQLDIHLWIVQYYTYGTTNNEFLQEILCPIKYFCSKSLLDP